MNQAIQILDGAVYLADRHALQIQAIVHGQLIACYISGAGQQQLLELYAERQFDIEELLEALIEDECFDADGDIHLSVQQLS